MDVKLRGPHMIHKDFLLEAYCLIDDLLKDVIPPGGLRQRGPAPLLSDAEAITIGIAGEFFGLDADKHIYTHFRRHYLAEFPTLGRLSRCSFVRQLANLWQVMGRIHQRLLGSFDLTDPVIPTALWLIDSFPLRICRLKRAPGCKRFRGIAAYGHDPTAGKDRFYGFRVHLRCCAQGPCAQIAVAPANVADLAMAAELIPPGGGEALGDRNYWSPEGQKMLAAKGLWLTAPFKKESFDPTPGHAAILSKLRQYIEPLIGQLAGRFHIQVTWAKDLWHLTERLTRKILGHTLAVFLNIRHGHPPLQLELLLDS
jgi:hypothetical protein